MPAFVSTAGALAPSARPPLLSPRRRPHLPSGRPRRFAPRTACIRASAEPTNAAPTNAAPPQVHTDHIDHAATDELIQSLDDLPLPPSTAIVRRMVEHLADSRGLARLALVDTFGRIGPPAVPALLDALQRSPNPVIRRSAGKALAKIGDAAATPTLLDVLVHDPDTVTRSSAAGALAKMGPTAVPSLLDLIADPDIPMTAKGHAAWAIAFMRGGDASAQALFDAAGSSSDDVRIAVVSALGAVAIGDSLPVMAAGTSDAADAWDDAGDDGDGDGDDGDDVDAATRARAVATLRLMLGDASAEVCAEAATALANAGEVQDAPAIAALLQRDDAEVRRCAALSLMKLGDASFAAVLRAKADDESEIDDVRRVANLAANSLERAAARDEEDEWDDE